MPFLGFAIPEKHPVNREAIENTFIDKRKPTPKKDSNSKLCDCGKGTLVEMRSSDGRFTEIKCTKCHKGWFFPNYISNGFPWQHPDFKPFLVTPNPEYQKFKEDDI